MNLYLKIIMASTILSLGSSSSAQEMEEHTVVKLAIQENIECFEKAFRFSQRGDLTADFTISNIHYKLMIMKMPNWQPVFTFECSNQEIENYFKEKLNIK